LSLNFEQYKPKVYLHWMKKKGEDKNAFLKGNIYPGVDIILFSNKRKEEKTHPDFVAWFYTKKNKKGFSKGIYSKISIYINKTDDGEEIMFAKVGIYTYWYIIKNYAKHNHEDPDYYLYETPQLDGTPDYTKHEGE